MPLRPRLVAATAAVALTGIVIGAAASSATAAPQRAKATPPFALLGNHDVRAGTPGVWQQKFGVPPYYTFVVHTQNGDARFVVINDDIQKGHEKGKPDKQKQKGNGKDKKG